MQPVCILSAELLPVSVVFSGAEEGFSLNFHFLQDFKISLFAEFFCIIYETLPKGVPAALEAVRLFIVTNKHLPDIPIKFEGKNKYCDLLVQIVDGGVMYCKGQYKTAMQSEFKMTNFSKV